jgi:phage antirepressor YoqD-like protein
MNGRGSRTIVLVTLAAAALAALATAATAMAHGGGPGKGGGLRGPMGASTSALVTDAAKRLNVTRAKLVDAIEDSARSLIDQAATDGDIRKDDVADLKEDVADNLSAAMALSQTRTVASNLGITTTRLNDAFRAARKAAIQARIDDALEDDRIDKERADELKDELDDAELPGYKAGLFAVGAGFGPGPRGR